MTEPQPWPTTVQRGRGPGEAEIPDPDFPDYEIPTPRHGRPVERPGGPQPTHVRDIVGPRTPEAPTAAPQARRARPAAAPAVVARDSRALTALRVITYLLVSLASLVFLAAVVYGGIRYVQLRDAFSLSPFGTATGSSSPNAGTRPAICDVDPTNAACYGG